MKSNKNNRLRNALNPLAYLGVDPVTPSQAVIEERDPTDNDYKGFDLGTTWLNSELTKYWIMVKKDPAESDKWVMVYPGDGLGTTSFITDSGTAVEASGDINVIGGASITTSATGSTVQVNLANDVTVTTSLTITPFAYTGTLRSNALAQISSLADGTDGQVLIASSSGEPVWANLTAGSNVTITNSSNSITIAATGGGGGGGLTGLDTDSGTATLDGSDHITLAGGSNISTSASGTTATVSLDDVVVLAAGGSINFVSALTNRIHAPYGSSIAWGTDAMNDTSTNADNCVALGNQSQHLNRSADDCISIGNNALSSLVNGAGRNVCIGSYSGESLVSGERNTFVGTFSGLNCTGSHNIFIGDLAGDTEGAVDGYTRIGNATHTQKCFISGIYGKTPIYSPQGVVIIDAGEQLGSTLGTAGQILTSTGTGVEWVSGSRSAADLFYIYTPEYWYSTTSIVLGETQVLTAVVSNPNFYPGDGAGTPAKFTASYTGFYQIILQQTLHYGPAILIPDLVKSDSLYWKIAANYLGSTGNYSLVYLVQMTAGEEIGFKATTYSDRYPDHEPVLIWGYYLGS